MRQPVYEIEVTDRAEKDLRSVSRPHRARLVRAINRLTSNPEPSGSRRMKGPFRGLLRIRVGKYRVVYRVDSGKLVVFVIRLGSRQDIYQSLLRFLATLT